MKKKAQGLSLNTIIIAAIVLIVLVVLWAIFTGRMGVFTKGVKEAEAQLKCTDDVVGGQVASGSTCPTGKVKIPGSFSDITAGTNICCTA